MAKLVSLVVKLGALAFVLFLPGKYAIQLQLLGGVWIIQTLPAVVIGLYTRWLHRWALVLGWVAGMLLGTGMVAAQHFKTSVYPLHIGSLTVPGYAALYSLPVNIGVAILLTLMLRALNHPRVRIKPHPRIMSMTPNESRASRRSGSRYPYHHFFPAPGVSIPADSQYPQHLARHVFPVYRRHQSVAGLTAF